MIGNGTRILAAAGILSFAGLFVGVGIRLSTADEPKMVDLSDLRDAVKTASKRGDNVDEVARALDAFEKAMAKGWKPEPGNTSPPSELLVLRQVVEAAGRKGENVEDIRKQLEAVEMKLLGRVLVAPKPEVVPLGDPPKPDPRRGFPGDLPVRPRIEFPAFPQPEFPNRGGFGGGIDREALQKAMDLRMQAMKALVNDPNDPKALELAQQATEMMLKAIGGGRGGLIAPEMMFPDLGGFGRVPDRDRFRLGVRMEKLTPVLVEQLGLEAGRGIAIVEVIANSPAEKAGFKVHDVVLEFAGKPVSDAPEEFNKQVTAVKAGEKVDAVVLRKGKKVELKGIELPEVKADDPKPLRRVPQPRFDIKPLPFPNTLPDLGPKPGVLPGGGDGLPNLNPLGRGNGNFAIQSDQNGVKYSLQGTLDNGEAKLSQIVIEVDGKTIKAESFDKVPQEHRAIVEKLLKNAGGRVERRVKD